MKKFDVKTVFHSTVAFLAFLSLISNVYLVKRVGDFASPLLFALGLVIESLLVVIFVYSFLRALKQPLRILGSVLASAWAGILTNTYVRNVRESRTATKKWLTARLDHKNPAGLMLTIGIALSLQFFANFYGILSDLENHGPLTRIDTRVNNLMPSIRTPLQTSFFRFVTFTANFQIILLLVLLVGAILWRKRQSMLAAAFLVAVFAEESAAFALKHLIGRIRPLPSFRNYTADGFSFPSGHVLRATVLFGFISYLLYRSFKSSLLRLGIILGYIISVSLVALSRVYLGIHYPSDVLASVLMGSALLSLIITGLEIAIRYQLWGQSLKNITNRFFAFVPIVVVLASIVASPVFIHLTPIVTTPTFITVDSLNQITVKKLPRYSETLTARTMEPINFIYLGSEQQIVRLFLSHGWYEADPSTLANTLKALAVGFQGHQYLTAPVTPSYLAAKPENLAFQHPTQSNELRQRHHTRIWRTDFNLSDGRQIWVATASFDAGIEFVGAAKLPTHHIDPNIDTERAYIASSLGLKNLTYLRIVSPQAGKNASGDIFFTDGKALVINLKGG
jgi:membrane-associated phospholipid phosphatase